MAARTRGRRLQSGRSGPPADPALPVRPGATDRRAARARPQRGGAPPRTAAVSRADTGAKCLASGRSSFAASQHPCPISPPAPREGGQGSPRIGRRWLARSPSHPDPHLLLLAFEQQERLEGRRGVHPGAAAASRASAAPPQPPGHLSATTSGLAAAPSSGAGRLKTGSLPPVGVEDLAQALEPKTGTEGGWWLCARGGSLVARSESGELLCVLRCPCLG